MKKAIFPGTFDPFTLGHHSIVKRALTFMDEVIISLFGMDELAAAIGARVVHPHERRYRDVTTDSRQVTEESLFVALKGERFDGHDFIAQVIANRGCGAIVSRELDVPESFTLFVVDDVLKAFGRLAFAVLEKRREMGGFVTYGITGSNGKTTTKEILSTLLSGAGHCVLKTQGNHNNFVGLPMTVMQLRAAHDVAVLEMGTNAPGEIRYLSQIGRPDIGMITGVGPAHIEHFGSLEGVAEAKGELLHSPGLKKIILPSVLKKYYASNLPSSVEAVWCGEDTGIFADEIELSAFDTRFVLNDTTDSSDIHHFSVRLPLIGAHNISNFLVAYSAVRASYKSAEKLNQACESIKLPSGRLERLEVDGIVFLHDAYNANPASMEQALLLISKISRRAERCIILGLMGELGPKSPDFHREIGHKAGAIGAKKMLFVGAFADDYRSGAMEGGMKDTDICCVSNDELEKGIRQGSSECTKRSSCVRS